jgi:hypothetical protein
MKPSEYEKVKAWCKENGYKEIDKNLSFTKFPLYKHTFRGDGFYIELDAIECKFLDSNQKFIHLRVEIKAYKVLSTGFTNTLSLGKFVYTMDEMKSFIAKKDEFLKLAKEFGV